MEERDLALSVGTVPSAQPLIDLGDDAADDDFVEEVPRQAPPVGRRRPSVPARQRPGAKNAAIAACGPSSQAESGPCLTQASERLADFGGSPSQAARFSRLGRGRDLKRPDLSESIPESLSNLPLFLEHGKMSELLHLSEVNHRMEPRQYASCNIFVR